MSTPPKIIFNIARPYSAHHMLLRTAQRSLEVAEKQSAGCQYDELGTIVFSALGIEAFCNTVGERIFKSDWLGEHEKKCPNEKLELLAGKLGITYNGKAKPWITAIWLFGLRNRIVHAKPEFVKPNEKRISQKKYDAMQATAFLPNSSLEDEIKLSNAQRAFTTAVAIKEIFCKAIPSHDAQGLYVDGASGSISFCE